MRGGGGSSVSTPEARARILTYKNGKVNWEGEDIGPNDPIPEI